jgi:hypothetical protein
VLPHVLAVLVCVVYHALLDLVRPFRCPSDHALAAAHAVALPILFLAALLLNSGLAEVFDQRLFGAALVALLFSGALVTAAWTLLEWGGCLKPDDTAPRKKKAEPAKPSKADFSDDQAADPVTSAEQLKKWGSFWDFVDGPGRASQEGIVSPLATQRQGPIVYSE